MRKLLVGFLLYLAATLSAHAGVSCSVPFNLTNGTTADASQVMANYNAILACLANNTAESGANSSITALTGLTTPISPAQGGTSVYPATAPAAGTANAITVAATLPSGFGLIANNVVVFYASATNTTATTLEVNTQTVTSTSVPVCSGTCAPAIYRMTPSGPLPMAGGEIIANQLVVAAWDGSFFECISCGLGQSGGFGPITAITPTATTDLGTIPSHNASIAGTTTITSFGQSATTAYPIYRVYFPDATPIVYNQTNCSTTGGCINIPGGVSITTAAGDVAMLAYDGVSSGGLGNWHIWEYDKATGTALYSPTPLCGASGLLITNNSGTAVGITANSAVMLNSTGTAIFATNPSVTINDAVNGANGLDTGSLGNNSWYYHWLISTGAVTAGLDSLSSTSPTLPSGYTYQCRVGADITNGAANLFRVRQAGKHAQYVIGTLPAAVPTVTSGVAGTASNSSPVLSPVSISLFAPPTASEIYLTATGSWKNGTGNGLVEIAPNVNWGGTNNGPFGSNGNIYPFAYSTTNEGLATAFSMVLEGSTIAWASGASTGAVGALGWDDQVNAN